MPDWRWAGRVRRDQRRFLYAVRRNLCLDRNFVIAENYRRFWRRDIDLVVGTDKIVLTRRDILEHSDVQDWTGR